MTRSVEVDLETEVDVVVVGAGTAGIPCAVEAARAGARVLLVEKDVRVGGTLPLSGGHLSAAGTSLQRERGIEDSPAEHLADIRRISGGTAREDLVRVLVEQAPATLEWLRPSGVRGVSDTPRIIYGHEPYRTPRTYYGRDAGASVLAVLNRLLEETRASHELTLWTGAPVTGLLMGDDGAACGVEVLRGGDECVVRAGAVVLATGGYGADPELFAELEGHLWCRPPRPPRPATACYLGRSVGAALQGAGTLPAVLRRSARRADARSRGLDGPSAADPASATRGRSTSTAPADAGSPRTRSPSTPRSGRSRPASRT